MADPDYVTKKELKEALDQLKKEILEEVAVMFSEAVAEILTFVADEFAKQNKRISRLEEDMKIVKKDIAELKSDTREVKIELKQHNEQISENRTKLVSHSKRISTLEVTSS